MRKGGRGGKLRPCDVKEWNYFPSIEREKNNHNAFTSVNELKDNRVQVNEKENIKATCRGTHRICDLNKIERSLNEHCTCLFLQTAFLMTSSTIVALSTRPMISWKRSKIDTSLKKKAN